MFALSHVLSHPLESWEVKMLCKNPNPGLSYVLEPYLDILTEEMWSILAANPAALVFLGNHKRRIPTGIEIDWKKEPIDLDDYLEERYEWFHLSPYDINCETKDDLRNVSPYLRLSRSDYGDLVNHAWVIDLIEHGILKIDAFKMKHLHYVYEHPGIIIETPEFKEFWAKFQCVVEAQAPPHPLNN